MRGEAQSARLEREQAHVQLASASTLVCRTPGGLARPAMPSFHLHGAHCKARRECLPENLPALLAAEA